MKTINDLIEGASALNNQFWGWVVLHQPRRGSATSYVIAFVLVGIALLVRLLMAPVNAGFPYVAFFPAVTLAAVAGGLMPGLFATILGMLLATFFFIPPFYGFSFEAIRISFWSNMVFLMDGIIVSSSIEAMHRYRTRTAEKVSELQAQNEHIRQLQREAGMLLRRNQALMQNSMDGIHIMDGQGNLVEANDAFCQMLGYTRQEMTRLNVGDWDSQWSVEELRERFRELVGKSVKAETAHRCKDGALINVEISASGMELEGQIFIFAISRDITARKQALEARLRESEERFRGTLEQAAVGIAHTSLGGQLQQVNRKFCEMLGYSREELLQMNIANITLPDDLAENMLYRRQLLAGEISSYSMEKRYVSKDGSVLWANLTGSLLRDADGVPKFTIGVIEDIAERKHAELLAQQYGQLLESSFNEIYLFDAHNLNFILTSKGAEINLGYSAEELHQMTPLDLKPSFTPDIFEQLIAPLRSGEKREIFFETKHLRKDGTTYLVDVRLQLMQAEHPMFMAVIQDITERRQAETSLKQSRKMLRELVAQGEAVREEEQKRIARELHDELGQILTALRMSIALLRIEFGAHDAALLERVGGITELLDQSIKCTRDVVSNLRPVAMDMGAIAAIRWLCNEFTRHTGTPCVLNSPEELDMDEVFTKAIFRVVQESLTNAARYAEASKVEVTINQEADKISVTVDDNGKGFNYVDMAKHRTFGLLGMRERALALGGIVNIYSAPQEGTQIFFTVPTNEGGAYD